MLLNHLSSFNYPGLSLFSSTTHMATLCLLISTVSTCQHTFWFCFFYFFVLNLLDYICEFCPFHRLLLLPCPVIVLLSSHPFTLFFSPSPIFPFNNFIFHMTIFINIWSVILPLYFPPFIFSTSLLQRIAYMASMPILSPYISIMISMSLFSPQLSSFTFDRYLLKFTMCIQHRDLKIGWHRPCLQEFPI